MYDYIREKCIRNPPKSLIQIWEMLQKHYMFQNRDICSNCEFASKQRNVLKHDMRPNCVFASNSEMFENEIMNR